MKSRSLDIRGVGGTIQHYTTYIWYISTLSWEWAEDQLRGTHGLEMTTQLTCAAN